MIEPGLLADMRFLLAAPIWLEGRRHISEGTHLHYVNCIKALEYFFAELPLREIHIGHFEQYQKLRLAGQGGLKKAGASRINHELNTLSQILGRAGLWAAIAPHYQPLKLPKPKVGCALSPEEEERLFRHASSRNRWFVAYCCSLITANTTAGPKEIRYLKMRNVDLGTEQPAIHIEEGVKNEHRVRDIPLNEAAAWAVRQLAKRARSLGANDPNHFLLPHRAARGQRGADPTRPMGSWKKAWHALRDAAGLPHLRMYDLRHHAITRLLEDENVSERTVIEVAGHVSKQMLQRYSHIRMRTKAEALNALAKKAPQSVPAKLMLVKSTS